MNILSRFGLKSKSYGKGEDRHLTVSRCWTSQSFPNIELKICFPLRKFNGVTLVEELLNRGGESEKYILIAPDSGI